MKCNIMKYIALLAVSAAFVACLDSTETVDVQATPNTYMRAYGSIDNLPGCGPETEGMLVFVSDLRMVQICAGGTWQTVGDNKTSVAGKRSSCTTKMLKDSSGVKVICDGDSVGVVKNGAKGATGEKGETGDTGETGAPGATGATGAKGDKGDAGAAGTDGKPGEKGETGSYCRTWYLSDGDGYKIVCDGDSVGVLTHGTNGIDANDCSVQRTWVSTNVYNYNIYCNGDYMGTVKYGTDAGGCFADTLNGVVRIRCGEDTTSFVLEELGECTEWREGVIAQKGNAYYICSNSEWTGAIEREYDTYGHNCYEDGIIISGNVSGKYYYCDNSSWRVASKIEFDAQGLTCTKDGALVRGVRDTTNLYVCDGGRFREAEMHVSDVSNDNASKFTEEDVGLGCTSYTSDSTIELHYGDFWYAILKCYEDAKGYWVLSEYRQEKDPPYGTMTDTRDNKTYKTVVIGSQTWMAENLNYGDSTKFRSLIGGRSRCSASKPMNADTCAKYGRAYRWSAVMDSVHSGCGYYKNCSVNYPFQGICPDGWHLPTRSEYLKLIDYAGGTEKAKRRLSATQGWHYINRGRMWMCQSAEDCLDSYENYNGNDTYGFAAYPTDGGESSYIFTSSEESMYDAYAFRGSADWYNYIMSDIGKNGYAGVRCVKD